jgi:hypothetical protein
MYEHCLLILWWLFRKSSLCNLVDNRTKQDGQAIAQLVGHDLIFWSGVREVCTISEPLVKVLRLVDGEKPAMGYLYEAMDRAKETIYRYYENKGEEGLGLLTAYSAQGSTHVP